MADGLFSRRFGFYREQQSCCNTDAKDEPSKEQGTAFLYWNVHAFVWLENMEDLSKKLIMT